MTPEQNTALKPSGWEEKVTTLNQELKTITAKAHSLKDIGEDNYEGVLTRRQDNFDSFHISLTLTEPEFVSAPEPIKMIFNDLGIDQTDIISIEIFLEHVSDNYEPHHQFSLKIEPEKITDDKFGISLGNKYRHTVLAPERRVFDEIHQPVWTRYDRGRELARLYEDELRGFSHSKHPYTVEILDAGITWFTKIVEGRRKSNS